MPEQQGGNEVRIILRAIDEYSKVFKDVEKLFRVQAQTYGKAVRSIEQDSKVHTNALAGTRKAEEESAAASKRFATETANQKQRSVQQQVALLKQLENAEKQAMQSRKGLVGAGLDIIAQLSGKSFDEATVFIDKYSESIVALGSKVAIVTAVLATLGAVAKSAFDLGEAGAQLERLRVTGTALAKSFGVNMTEAATSIKVASLDTITANQAVANVNRVLLLGITEDVGQMAKLMEIAALRGRAFGLSSTEAFDRITLGIGRLSTRILDDIGIVIDGETAYSKFGASIGKTADQLTEQQKRLALTAAIIEDGNKLLDASGGLIDDNAAAYERLSTHITDTTNAFKEHISQALSPAVRTLDDLLFSQLKLQQQLTVSHTEIRENSKNYEEYSSRLDEAAQAQGYVIDSGGNLIEIIQSEYGAIERVVTANYRLSDSEYQVAQGAKNATQYVEGFVGALQNMVAMQNAALATTQAMAQSLASLSGTVSDFKVEGIAKQIAEYNSKLGIASTSTDAFLKQFGVADQYVLDFRDALEAALGPETLGGVGITAEELSDALLPLDRAQIQSRLNEIKDQMVSGAGGIGRDIKNELEKLWRGFQRDLADAFIDFERKLRDIDIKGNQEREDLARDHIQRLENIQIDHQRRLTQIQQKFELSRLRALIDLDARALFEAEAQRDSDVADAKRTADEKRTDEEREYEERQHRLEEQLTREREAAQRQLEDQRADALLQYQRQLEDLDKQGAARVGSRNKKMEEEKEALEKKLKEIEEALRRQHEKERNQERIQKIKVRDERLRKQEEERQDTDRHGQSRSNIIRLWLEYDKTTTQTTMAGITALMSKEYGNRLIDVTNFVNAYNAILAAIRGAPAPPTGGRGGVGPPPAPGGGGGGGGPAPSPVGGGCFIAGTLVTMASGKTIPIENVSVGDRIVSYDTEHREMVISAVSKTFHHTALEIEGYYLINNRLGVTADHMLYINSEWMIPREVLIGDCLLGHSGEEIKVVDIVWIANGAKSYNLHTDHPTHNYFANGILVHNAKTERQHGGPTKEGEPYIVGEKGPEIFVPKHDGYIIPNNRLPEPRQSGGDVNSGKPYLVGEKGPELLVPQFSKQPSLLQTRTEGGEEGQEVFVPQSPIPRAKGGRVNPNEFYLVGEKGPEVFSTQPDRLPLLEQREERVSSDESEDEKRTGRFVPMSRKRERGGDVDLGKAYLVGEKGQEIFIPQSLSRSIPPRKKGGEVSSNKPYLAGEEGTEIFIPQPPSRQKGGNTSSKEPYLVGENGPEIFVPKRSGYIIPNNRLSPPEPRQLGGSVRAGEQYLVGEKGPEAFTTNRGQQSQLLDLLSGEKKIKVIMEVRGSGAFAEALKETVYNAFVDIVDAR